MMTEAHDVYLIHVPDSLTLPRLAWRHDAVVRAMYELGARAQVHRVTLGHVCRDVTADFLPKSAAEDYVEADDWRPAHTRSMARSGAFGTR